MKVSAKNGFYGLAMLAALAVAIFMGVAGTASAADKNVSDYIGIERAKSIAFEHAKVDASKVYKLDIDLDNEDGRMIYEVDFKHDGWEYEYEIDAKTGEIIRWDKDRD